MDMATVKKKSEEGQTFAYVVLHNGMDKLLHEIDMFCKGEYGRKCDLYEAYIAKRDPNNYPVKVHEFHGVGADLLDKVRNHLQDARDFIKFTFSADDQEFSIDIIPGTEQEYLVDRMHKEDLDELQESDTVVMVEAAEDVTVAETFLENVAAEH